MPFVFERFGPITIIFATVFAAQIRDTAHQPVMYD